MSILTSACNFLASSSVSKVTNPYPLEHPPRSLMILVALTLPKPEKSLCRSASVVVELMPPTKTRLGTRVPYLMLVPLLFRLVVLLLLEGWKSEGGGAVEGGGARREEEDEWEDEMDEGAWPLARGGAGEGGEGEGSILVVD